jgi:hypothetical protein
LMVASDTPWSMSVDLRISKLSDSIAAKDILVSPKLTRD